MKAPRIHFAALLLLLPLAVHAQAGGPYRIERSTVDGGGTAMEGGGISHHGTAGQPDGSTLNGGPYVLRGGLWAGAAPAATPTVTVTGTPPATSTPTLTRSHTRTATHTNTPTRSATPTRTTTGTLAATPTGTKTPVSTSTATASEPTPTPAETTPATATATAAMSPSRTEATRTPAATCAGDCNGDDVVSIGELIRLVNIALGSAGLDLCPAGDVNGDEAITINELIGAVNNALYDCPESARPRERGEVPRLSKLER